VRLVDHEEADVDTGDAVEEPWRAEALGRETHCDACFTGDYPLEHTESANGKFALEESAVELPVLPRA
jgi:hypothetical protein